MDGLYVMAPNEFLFGCLSLFDLLTFFSRQFHEIKAHSLKIHAPHATSGFGRDSLVSLSFFLSLGLGLMTALI